MKIIQYRSIIVHFKRSEIYSVSDSCMLLAKNIYNASLFLLNNLISSYTYDKESKNYTIKEKLHNNQLETIALFNQSIKKLNQTRLNKFQVKLKDNKSPKEPKQLLNLTNNISIKDFQSIILDKTLLEQALKLKESNKINDNKEDNYIDYTKIPSIIAQYALQKAVNDISIYYKSLIAFYKDKLNKNNTFTGLPKLPKYLCKNDRLTLEINHSYFTKQGILFKINPDKHTLYTDFYKQDESIIKPEDIEVFNQFNLKEALLAAIDKRINKRLTKAKIKYNLQTVRFVPQRISNKGKNKQPLKIEVIIEVEQEINDDSPIALLIQFYNQNKDKYKTPTLDYHELKGSIKDKVMLDFIKDNAENLTYLAGGDLGQNNLFTLALTRGKNQIYSGYKINQYLTKLNTKLDQLKSSIFESSLSKALYEKIKYNQKITEQNKDIFKYNELNNLFKTPNEIEKLDKLPLNTEELKLIKEANTKVYTNIKYNKILIEMENYKNNILHKLSDNIIQHCVKNKIQCLVVGLNEHWKQDINLSKETNRLFMSIPHSKLIELLEYKAFAKGLLFITTEESYTSKASFLHNDPLPTYNKTYNKSINKEPKSKENKEPNVNININNSQVEVENNHSHKENHIENSSKVINKFSGTRNRHVYQFKEPLKRMIKSSMKDSVKEYEFIHADINGAFNMLRKIFKDFSYDNETYGRVSINYEFNQTIIDNYHKKTYNTKISNNSNLNRALASSSSIE